MMMRMPRPSREQVLAEIRETALRLFVEQGFAETTLAQIGAEVGYSKSAMLYHFGSKDALLVAALDEPLSRLSEHLAVTAGRPALERLEAFIDLVLAHRHEAALLVSQGPLLKQLYTLGPGPADLLASYLGDQPTLERQVSVLMTLSGLADTVGALVEIPAAELRGPLLAAAARALNLDLDLAPTLR